MKSLGVETHALSVPLAFSVVKNSRYKLYRPCRNIEYQTAMS